MAILQRPVRFIDTDFADLTIEGIERSIKFAEKLPGGRETVYFSPLPNSCGRIIKEFIYSTGKWICLSNKKQGRNEQFR